MNAIGKAAVVPSSRSLAIGPHAQRHGVVVNGRLPLALLPARLAVCRLPGKSGVPHWAVAASDVLVYARTPEETTIICDECLVPEDVRAERGFRALRAAGPIPFQSIGVLSGIANALADARVSLLALSTFDTDYVLIRESSLAAAVEALHAAGHEVAGAPSADTPPVS